MAVSDRFGPRRHAEFAVDGLDVRPDRVAGYEALCRDVRDGQPRVEVAGFDSVAASIVNACAGLCWVSKTLACRRSCRSDRDSDPAQCR